MIRVQAGRAESNYNSAMALAKRSVAGSYPLPSWMHIFRDVSVVLTSRVEDWESLESTLEALRKTEAPWKEILVVGRGREVFKLRSFEERFQRVRVLSSGDISEIASINQGFVAAKGKWILFLEANCLPDVPSWEGLCRILTTEPEDDLISFSVLRQARKNLRQLNRASLLDAGAFKQAGFLMNRSSLETIGGFDDELPYIASESHWVARVIRAGGSILQCPEACIIQDAVGILESNRSQAFEICCNQLLLILRYAPIQNWKDHFRRRIRDILVYSLLHRTPVYFRAMRHALKLWAENPEKIKRLSDVQFRKMTLDWMTPYGFIG